MNVGALRKAIEKLPDDAEVRGFYDGGHGSERVIDLTFSRVKNRLAVCLGADHDYNGRDLLTED
jgi:hypothetical protein